MKHLNVNAVVEWVSTVCPHPNLPPAKPGEGVYIPSPGFAGGGSGWGQAIDGEFDR